MDNLKKIVIASSNKGKLAEMQAVLKCTNLLLINQTELGVTEAIENGHTFVENALIKARHAATITGLPAIADDSGLIVDALGGAPGLISAHYAGVHGDASSNIKKLLAALTDVPEAKRAARFYSLIVFLRHANDPQPLIAEGIWEGRILEAPRGEGGFGYDPVFFDPLRGMSAAEMPAELKNQISHRGIALAKLREHFFTSSAI